MDKLFVASSVGLIGVLVLGKIYQNKKQDFSIHSLDLPLYAPPNEGCMPNLSPTPSEMNIPLQPNTVRMVIQGYNYQSPLVFYRDGQKIIPMEYAWDSDNLVYYTTLTFPKGVCNHDFVIETYDHVKPMVINQDSQTEMKVSILRRRLGFNRWKVEC